MSGDWKEGFAEKITAKTLVVDGEAEEWGQAKELFAALRCPKDYLLFTASEAAQLHVQTGSPAISNQRIFDWLPGAENHYHFPT